MKKILLVLTCIVAMAMMIVGCGGSDKKDAAKGNDKKITVGFSVSTQNNPFFVSLAKGVEAKAKELGVTVKVVDAQNDPAKQANDIADLLQQNISVLLVNPVDSDAISTSVKAANKANIPVICLDRSANQGDVACLVASDNVKGGEMAADYIIKKLGEKYGFAVEIVPPVMYKGEAVSSTRIRACLEAGRVKDAGEMLGTPYSITGPVIRNRGIGRTLDYPTANIAGWEDRAVPMAGVYATRAVLDGEKYPAVTNIGRNPTVNGEHTTIETHMLGFDADIYGQTLKVEFVERIRGEIRFPDVHTLATQMKADGEKARDILKNS